MALLVRKCSKRKSSPRDDRSVSPSANSRDTDPGPGHCIASVGSAIVGRTLKLFLDSRPSEFSEEPELKKRSEKKRDLKKPRVTRFGAIAVLTRSTFPGSASPQQIAYDSV